MNTDEMELCDPSKTTSLDVDRSKVGCLAICINPTPYVVGFCILDY